MTTLLFNKVDKVVAAVPMHILEISPTASFSSSVNTFPDAEDVSAIVLSTPPASKAFISSWDNIPSINLLLLPYY